MQILTTQSIRKQFEGVTAIEHLDLSVEKGSIHGVIGPNGSGKTTLINLISGLLDASGGEIYFEDENITHMSAHTRTKLGIARTFQIPRIMPELTCLENVLVGAHCRSTFDLLGTWLRPPFFPSRQEDRMRRKSIELLGFIGLEGDENRKGADLSWVEEQMVQICRALMSEPKLLLLDEPSAGMGGTESLFVQDVIKKIAKDLGITTIVVAHDMKLIMEITDQVTCLSFGNKISEGSHEEVRKDPKVLEVYLGKE